MHSVRFTTVGAAVLLLMCTLRSQDAPDPLDPAVRQLVEQSLAGAHPEADADRMWQAASAVHGSAAPLIADLGRRFRNDRSVIGAARLLIGVLRYEGSPTEALRIARAIEPKLRTPEDSLVHAELLDTLGRTKDAAAAYDALLAGDLATGLQKQILFRRALMGEESAQSLETFARSPDRTVEERNQAAVILGLRDRAAAAIDLFEVSGDGTARFRQLIRLAEWAMEAKDYDRAQQLAWEAVEVAKMRRDRRYALTVAVSAFRAGDAVDALVQRFEQSAELDDDARQVWIDLLRDEGRVDDALRLFRDNREGNWTSALRRQLLEICRDTGRQEVLVATFRELISAQPENLEWRSGLSRHYLENGDAAAAAAVWDGFDRIVASPQRQLDAAYALRDLGIDQLALPAAERAAQNADLREQAWLFAVGLHLARGQFELAQGTLEQIEAQADPDAPVRAEVAGFYERMGRIDRAVAVMESMRRAYGGSLGTDLDMKFALLLSKVNREEDALEVWRSLWVRLRNTPRGRYVEDRMMTVAARIGVLAKIAIELEDRLDGGEASTADVDLLVRLYIKVGDSAAATEITEEFLRRGDFGDLEIVRRKANIYLACQDYVEYETMIEQLVEHDEENRLDHMRELLLSRLERGRRDQAIQQLPAIRAASGDDESSDEFEAGVYLLAGMTDEALTSYVKGLGRHPDRIDTHLLVANLMRENGAEMQAARRFQYLASSADKDDLFTIAIDGILNLRAVGNRVPNEVVEWAMRLTLERLANSSDRFYLYRLAADLAEELNDMPMAIRTLTAGLPAAGERRTALLRELLGKLRSLDRNARQLFGSAVAMQISNDWDSSQYVTLGRRLLGQGEIVPPQVYMDLATVFLRADAVADAMRTFSRAAELLERSEINRQAAKVLEDAKRYDAALSFYRRLLAVESGDVTLLRKIGRLEELAGRDANANEAYRRGLETALQQTALRVHVAEVAEEANDPLAALYGQRNVDAVQAAIPKLVEGVLITLNREQAPGLVAALRDKIEGDLAAVGAPAPDGTDRIESFPRLAASASALRRIALCFRQLDVADAIDKALLRRFANDHVLAEAVVRQRSDRGFYRSAAEVIAGTSFAADPTMTWLAGGLDIGEGLVSPSAAAARVVPLLAADRQRLRVMLESVDTAAINPDNVGTVPLLLGACAAVGATEAAERIARAGIRADAAIPERERLLRGSPGMQAVKLGGRVDPELGRALTRAVVARAAAQGAQAVVRLTFQLPSKDDLQLDAETSERLLHDTVVDSESTAFGMVQGMELLRFVPEERRPSLLRELHDEASNSVRLSLLTRGAEQIDDPVTKAFVEWYAAVFPTALQRANDMQRNSARFGGQSEGSKQLSRVRLEALLAREDDPQVRANLIATLVALGDREAAIAALDEGMPRMLAPARRAGVVQRRAGDGGPDRAHIRRMVDQISSAGLLEAAVEIVERKLAATPDHEAMRVFRWSARSQLPGAMAFVESALRADPDNRVLLERAYEFHRDRGHLVEATEFLERLATGDEAATWQRRLASAYRELGNKAAEARVRTALNPQPQPARATAAISIATSVVISRSGAAVGPRGRPAPIAAEILALEDAAEARRRFREHWRGPERNERFVLVNRGPQLGVTPATLAALRDVAFVRDEAERMLRLFEDAGKLGGAGIVPELFGIVTQHEDPERRLRSLARELDSGNGGSLEAGQVLWLLSTDAVSAELRTEIVNALLARIEAPDAGALRQLAFELARVDRKAEAAVLYRLGVLAKDVDIYSRNQFSAPETEKFLTEVEEQIGGELGRETVLALVDDYLMGDEQFGANAGAMEALALATWQRLLPAEDVAPRARGLRARINGGRYGRTYMNQSGKGAILAAGLAAAFGRVGDFDAAIEEFAQLVRKPQPDGRLVNLRRNARRPQEEQVNQFLAVDWGQREEWLRAVGRSCLAWHAKGELIDPVGTLASVGQAVAVLSGAALGQSCRDALAALATDDSRARVALAALERALGNEAEADAIETDLLAQRRLPIADHVRVIAGIRDRDGVEAALAAGERALSYTSDTALLEQLVGLCDEAGQPERAKSWRSELDARREEKNKAKSEDSVAPRRAGR